MKKMVLIAAGLAVLGSVTQLLAGNWMHAWTSANMAGLCILLGWAWE